jgi:hypothetical protein
MEEYEVVITHKKSGTFIDKKIIVHTKIPILRKATTITFDDEKIGKGLDLQRIGYTIKDIILVYEKEHHFHENVDGSTKIDV